MPPRHGKSLLVSQYSPAWFLGRWPDNRVILASYEAELAKGWGRKARDVLAEFGGRLFGVGLRDDSYAADRWDLAGHVGGMVTAGVGGPITGRGADLLIIDDPVKNAEEARSPTQREKTWDWYLSTAYTRLSPDGAVVLVMTRWHMDDLASRILKHAKETGERWDVVKLPALAGDLDQMGRLPGEALWPERYPADRLRAIEQDVGPYWWSSLYQQDDVPEGGTEWPSSYFGPHLFFDDWPTDLRTRVMSLDPSKGKADKSGDYSAFVMLGWDGQTMWVDCDLDNTRPVEPLTSAPERRSIVEDGLRLYREWNPQAILIECNGFQEWVASAFSRMGRERGLTLPLYKISNVVPKVQRIRTLGPFFAQRRIRVRNTPGGRMLVAQARDFALASHDDALDALHLGITMLDAQLGRVKGKGGPQLAGG